MIDMLLQFDQKQKDAVMIHMTRMIGAVGVGSAVISLQAPGFLHEHDKRRQFLSRLIVS